MAGITAALEQKVLEGYFVEGRSEETLARELRVTRYKVRKTVKTIDRKMRRFLKQHGLDA